MAGTIPTPKNSKTMDTNISFEELSDGTWYFHIVSVDREGVVGGTPAHFKVQIKTKVKLKGVITQSNGIMPLSGATVEVMKEDGTTMGIGISDKEGSFSIDNLAVGKVKIKVLTKGLPPQMLYDIELNEEEPEKEMNISSEIFGFYEAKMDRFIFNYYIPEDGAVSVKLYNESGKLINTIDEEKKGRIYNTTPISASGLESGVYLYQVTSKGKVTNKITRYGIRKVKK